MKQKLSVNKGFTLVEVIISIAILSVVSVVALQLFLTSQKLNSNSRHADIASVLATNYIELIKLYDTTETLTHDLDRLSATDHGFNNTTYTDQAFEYLPDAAPVTDRYYLFVCDMTGTDKPGLYDIVMTVTDTKTEEVLVEYRTAHYFKGEVTADAFN